MNNLSRHGWRIWRTAAVAAAGLALAAGAAACGGASSIAAALQQPATLTFWAWAPQSKDIVAAFEKKYPKVKVNLVNAGTAADEYTKLDNAIKAGSGAPDVAQIEYYALPQFALEGSLADLGDYGMDTLNSDYDAAVWDAV